MNTFLPYRSNGEDLNENIREKIESWLNGGWIIFAITFAYACMHIIISYNQSKSSILDTSLSPTRLNSWSQRTKVRTLVAHISYF